MRMVGIFSFASGMGIKIRDTCSDDHPQIAWIVCPVHCQSEARETWLNLWAQQLLTSSQLHRKISDIVGECHLPRTRKDQSHSRRVLAGSRLWPVLVVCSELFLSSRIILKMKEPRTGCTNYKGGSRIHPNLQEEVISRCSWPQDTCIEILGYLVAHEPGVQLSISGYRIEMKLFPTS